MAYQQKLERVQEKAVKMVSGLKEDNYKDKCNELRLETLKERRAQKNPLLAHKCVGGSIAGGDNLFRKTDEPDRVKQDR